MEPYATFNEMTANCQQKVIQTKDGPLTILWDKDKTFEQIAAEFVTAVYRFNKGGSNAREASGQGVVQSPDSFLRHGMAEHSR